MTTPTADAFLASLAADIGYTESPPGTNCNRYSRALGRPCEKWCADLLVAKARTLGLGLPSDSPSTQVMAAAFKKAKRWSAAPIRGAFAFFDFPDSSTGIQHIGCVEDWTPTTLDTFDGNTSSGHGSQDNGGEVAHRTRPRRYAVGYGLPFYGVDVPIPPLPSPTPHPEDPDMAPLPMTISGDPTVDPAALYCLLRDPAHGNEERLRHVQTMDTLGHLVGEGLVGAGLAGVHTHEVMPRKLVDALGYRFGSDLA